MENNIEVLISKNDYDKCTKCKTGLEQKENNKCSNCGHTVTKREALLYKMNTKKADPKGQKEWWENTVWLKTMKNSGFLGQVFLGFLVMMALHFFGILETGTSRYLKS